MASGLAAEDSKRIAEARRASNGSPYASLREVVTRAGVGQKAIAAIAEVDGFAGLSLDRRAAIWNARGVEDEAPPLLRFAAQAAAVGKLPLLRESSLALPRGDDGPSVVLDYASTGLTLRRHPLALRRPALRALGCRDSSESARLRTSARVKLAGILLVRHGTGPRSSVPASSS